MPTLLHAQVSLRDTRLVRGENPHSNPVVNR